MPAAGDVTKVLPKAPDGGWSWVVVACAFFNSIIIFAITVTFGVVFSEKLTAMDVSSTTMTWIYNLFNFNFYFMSVLSGPLSDVFSWRSVGFVAATITGGAYLCMGFVTGPGLLFLLFSVLVGCSDGLTSFIGYLTVPHYFDYHRGRAGAIMMTGTALGQVIVPLLMHQLLSEYGFAGACLIYAGLVFNSAVLCLFYYPVRRRPLLKGDRMNEAAKKEQIAHMPSKEEISDTNGVEKLNKKHLESFRILREKSKEILKITWHHIGQLQHSTLFITTLSSALLIAGYGNFTALLPFAMAARGHSAAAILYSLSIGALTNTLSRIFVSWASDADWFSRKICYIFGSVVSGVSTFATVFVLQDSQWIMVCQIFWGLGIGASLSVFYNLIIDTCGRELYNSGVAVSSLLMAVCNIFFGPLIGVARDYTSYEVGIGMTAALQITCALLWVFMPLARRYDMEKFPDRQLTEKKSGEVPHLDTTVLNRKRAVGEQNAGFEEDPGVSLS